MKRVLQTEALAIGYRPVRRPEVRVADGIELALHAGELVCLLGPNGAGKSTLMRTLAGMQRPLSGRALLAGDDVHQLTPQEVAKRLSIVLTERPDLGLMNGYALVALGRYPYTNWTGRLSRYDRAMVRWAVEAVGAADIAERPVMTLSDGQRQKLMIARALAQESDLILLDEPTAFLDLPRRVEVMQLLKRLAAETGQAILLSTHDLELALRTADTFWLMNGGRVTCGAPEDLVLSGAFAAAFAAEGVTFDPFTGAFRTVTAGRGAVAVVGEGLAAVWARRALQRAGYDLNDTARLRVIACGADGRYGWRVEDQVCESVDALLKAVEAALEA
ncbi:MAG: ABC transporter ATP-binding protein [Anaerolineae bacterium]